MAKAYNLIQRYYAEYSQISGLNHWERAWQIFDREGRDPFDHNLPRPIATCEDRKTAFLIRDALNCVEVVQSAGRK